MTISERERALVVGLGGRAMLAHVRYFVCDEDIPADVLSAAARQLYIEGQVSVETFEHFLDLQHGLLKAS